MEEEAPKAQQFLKELGEQIGLPELAFNEENLCFIEADQLPIQLEWEPDSNQLVFLSAVGQSPTEKREAFFEALLRENFLYHGTVGETLSVEPNSGRVMLCYLIQLDFWPVSLALRRFVSFIEVSNHWVDRLNNGFPGDVDEPSPQGSSVRLGSLA